MAWHELLNLMKVDVVKEMMWWLMTVDRISSFFLGGWRDTLWIFILKSEICNSAKSTAKRSRDCNSTPPSYGSYPDCPNRSRWTAGWCSGCVAFPCKQDSTTNLKKHPNPETGQAVVGQKRFCCWKVVIFSKQDVLGLVEILKIAWIEGPGHFIVKSWSNVTWRYVSWVAKPTQTMKAPFFRLSDLKNCQQNSLSQIRQTQSWSS